MVGLRLRCRRDDWTRRLASVLWADDRGRKPAAVVVVVVVAVVVVPLGLWVGLACIEPLVAPVFQSFAGEYSLDRYSVEGLPDYIVVVLVVGEALGCTVG